MTRKILSLVLCLMLALTSVSVLAETVTATYPLVSEPLTVTGMISTTNKPDNPRIVWQKLEEITGIHVDFKNVESDALGVYMAAGDWPDFFHHNLDATYINDYGILGGMFIDYNEYMQYMPYLQDTFADYPELTKIVTETNGAIYQLPRLERSATTTQARVYYRTDVMEAAGLTMPTTTEEFYNVLVALKEYNKGAAPLIASVYSGAYFEPLMYSCFGPSTNPDFEDDDTGVVVFNRTSDQYRHFLEYMTRLYKEGLLHQEFLTMDGTTRLSLASEGLGVFMDGTAHSLVEKDFPSGNVDLGVLAPMTSEYDDEQVVLGQLVGASGGFAINSASKHIVELCQMIDIFFAEDEVVPGSGVYGIIGCYGPEGMMWQFSNEDKTQYEFILPEGYEGTTTNYQYEEMMYNNCGRVDVLANAVTSTPGNAQSRQLGFVANLLPYHDELVFPGNYLKFTEDEQYTLDSYYVDIKTYVEEMRSKFITGVADVATEWDAYCAQIEAMGIGEVLAVYQAAYDRWNGK